MSADAHIWTDYEEESTECWFLVGFFPFLLFSLVAQAKAGVGYFHGTSFLSS